MEAARTSETLVNFCQTTRCYNPEDSNLHTHRRENLKSYLPPIALLSYNISLKSVTSLGIMGNRQTHGRDSRSSPFLTLSENVLQHWNKRPKENYVAVSRAVNFKIVVPLVGPVSDFELTELLVTDWPTSFQLIKTYGGLMLRLVASKITGYQCIPMSENRIS
jgi:hypothetical protein